APALRTQDAPDGQHQARLARPVGPEQRGDLPGGNLDVDIAHDRPPAATHGEPTDLERVRSVHGYTFSSVPRYARITRSSRRTWSVGPELISFPKSSTAVVSQHPDTRLMSWSTRMVSAPVCSGILRITFERCSVSSSGRPAAGSSSSTSFGVPTTARATSTRRRSPTPRVFTWA